MKFLDVYVILIVLIKVLFVCLAVMHLYMKIKHRTDSELDKTIVYLKGKIEFMFVLLMSLLLIYLFNPRVERSPDKETKLLFFLFGIVLLITAKWNEFVNL
jgi:hypothetical protein